ncbi:hypothetical protein LOK49_LG03G00645 [Camellia lanceoleosa]|uniref:Uncharacterized protein n=1 Tax=Camellia lanceoleosa TaxID=1840588 RepID=A0ACC0IE88_9ERIC|nr:hypothetical protein LOK49_LG03G00645 [Camellia lanceoleosa]
MTCWLIRKGSGNPVIPEVIGISDLPKPESLEDIETRDRRRRSGERERERERERVFVCDSTKALTMNNFNWRLD